MPRGNLAYGAFFEAVTYELDLTHFGQAKDLTALEMSMRGVTVQMNGIPVV
jgi:hypothetical protein